MKRTLVALATALALAGTACAQTADFSQRVPAPLRKAGVLRVGTSPTYPPLEYVDPMTQKLQGLDIDLVEEIGRRLGLKVQWSPLSFDQLPSSLDTDRIDMGASGITDIPQRRDKMDFIDYFATGAQIFTSKNNPAKLAKAQDICGKPVAVNRNGIFYIRLQDFEKSVCEAQGLPPIQYSLTDKTADARLQIIQGRVVAAVMGVDAVHYLNESANSPDRGGYVLIGAPISTDVAGFGFTKTNTALRDLVADVVTSMIADGSYAKIFEKWQLPSSEMRAVTINAQQGPAAKP
jgi:polar amino acid transport system substrate-binding protein